MSGMMGKQIRLVVVDDHAFLRDGVRALIEAQPDMEVVGEAADAKSALAVVAECLPEVVIMDIQLPDGNGIDTAVRILTDRPAIRVIILSGFLCPEDIHRSLKMGIFGYISKVTASSELIHAVRAVLEGKRFLCPEMATALLLEEQSKASDEHPSTGLSEREKYLLRLVAEGKRNKEIAGELHVTAKSVETYRSRLMAKLACPSTAELVRYAIRQNIVAA
jgi:DNA-binding NarL/FixJ family response regulator